METHNFAISSKRTREKAIKMHTAIVRERRRRGMRGRWLHRRHLCELHGGRVRRKRAEMTGNGDRVSLKSAAHRGGHLGHRGRHLSDSGAGHLVNAGRLVQRRRAVMQRRGYLRYPARHLRYLRYLSKLVASRGVLARCQRQTGHRMSYATGVFAEARPAITEPHLKQRTPCLAMGYRLDGNRDKKKALVRNFVRSSCIFFFIRTSLFSGFMNRTYN